MSPDTPSTVVLRGTDQIEYKERQAAEELRPGMNVEYADGDLQAHSTAGVGAGNRIVIERRARGMVADNPAVDGTDQFDSYAATETTLYGGLDKGHQYWGLLAAGESVTDGEPLVSDGDGGLRAVDGPGGESASDATVEAIEVVDNSGGAEYARVRVEVR